MTDLPPNPDGQPADQRPQGNARRYWAMRSAVLIQLLSCAGLLSISWNSPRRDALASGELILAAIGMLAAICLAFCCGRVERSVTKMAALLRGVRAGWEPVGSLTHFGGFLAGLAGVCHDLAHDLRTEQSRTAQLENEIRQRIANRTQALERTIGTLRQQAARDGLTGLFNRRSLDAYLPDATERCRESGAPLCVLMIDIDFFKPLNDTLGHASGDQMLKSVAQIIRSTIRENDLAFRSGGDEFVVALEECDEAAGRLIAERLGALGDSLGKTFRLLPPPSLSVGVAMLADVKDRTAAALLSRADEALYQIKALHHAAAAASASKPRKSA
jgi:diguanylate cyclase (GGDEF)-like protein